MRFQVVVVAGFTPVEEVESISMGPREMGERVVRDFFREGWVGDHGITTSMVDLAEEVGLRDLGEAEEEEDTLGEAVEILLRIPVGVVVDPTQYPHQKFSNSVILMRFQVVVVAGFTPVEEVESISMGPREMGERVVRDFFREGWVGDHGITTSMVDLAEEVGLRDLGEAEEEEDTLGEAVEILLRIPVGVVVDPTMLETISRMNVVTTRLVMVR